LLQDIWDKQAFFKANNPFVEDDRGYTMSFRNEKSIWVTGLDLDGFRVEIDKMRFITNHMMRGSRVQHKRRVVQPGGRGD
jgi:hypothetical protein